MKAWLLQTLMLMMIPAVIMAADEYGVTSEKVVLPVHQDSSHLGLTTSAVMPADGLMSFQLGMRKYTTVYQLTQNGEQLLKQISQFDWYLKAEAVPLPWLELSAEIPFRTWSGGQDWIPDSGSGLGDGQFQATVSGPSFSRRFSGALYGGGNIPMGGEGLTEDAFSPQAGAALTWRFWLERQVPELRLHLNLGYRWNKNEEYGYGMGQQGFQPWAPRYPSAEAVGGDSNNDQLLLRAALEFRKNTTSLWLEYSQDRFGGTDAVSRKEQFTGLGAGLRWGVMEGWALHGSYLVSLIKDDPDSGWDPAFPEWVMQVGVSRQFSIGGHDEDGDGIVDRKDTCPRSPEDMDGFQDEDGCPDDDNDMDGIPDALDGAPNEAEDFDGWKDYDGIPEPDNDADGIPDIYDLCPNQPEDHDGHRDDDGCPDLFSDQDGDGVGDDVDGCPDEPEDLDGYEDQDGCPDEDNDLDGINDDEDQCPDDPEDYDGVDDDDGCPDSDIMDKLK